MNVEPTVLKDGRTAYRVGGAIVLDPQDALDLLSTGAFRVRDPLTQQAMATGVKYRMRVVANTVDPSDRKAVVEIVDSNGATVPYTEAA